MTSGTHQIYNIIIEHVIFWSTPPSPSSDDVIYEQPLSSDDDADDDGGCDKNIVYNCFCLLSLAKEISSSSLFVIFCFYIF